LTKFALVVVIACGILLGQIALELLGLLFNSAGKIVGKAISGSLARMIATRQEQANAAAGKREEVK
jgi:hypothetical protein